MLEDAVAFLEALGVAGAGDDPFLPYLINSVELVVGEYLTFKKNAGQLDMNGLDFEAAIKQIQEGDTNTVFAVGEGSLTPEQRLEVLISRLTRDRTREFIRYRRLVW